MLGRAVFWKSACAVGTTAACPLANENTRSLLDKALRVIYLSSVEQVLSNLDRLAGALLNVCGVGHQRGKPGTSPLGVSSLLVASSAQGHCEDTMASLQVCRHGVRCWHLRNIWDVIFFLLCLLYYSATRVSKTYQTRMCMAFIDQQ